VRSAGPSTLQRISSCRTSSGSSNRTDAVASGKAPHDKGEISATIAATIRDAPAPFLRAGSLRPIIGGRVQVAGIQDWGLPCGEGAASRVDSSTRVDRH
jgi:hypothetical protein